jgi:hypothetical protein
MLKFEITTNKYVSKKVFGLLYLTLATVITGFSSLYHSNTITLRKDTPALNLMSQYPEGKCQLISDLPSYGWPVKYVTGTGKCPGIYKYLLPLGLLADVVFYFILIWVLGMVIKKVIRQGRR